MRARALAAAIVLALLLTGCTSRMGVHLLETQEEARLYIRRADAIVEVRIPHDLLGTVADGFFGLVPENRELVDAEVMESRDGLYASLASALAQDDPILTAARHSRELRSSGFCEAVDRLTGTFDEEAFMKDLEGATRHYVYSLDEVLSHMPEGGDVDAFMALWLNSALDLD